MSDKRAKIEAMKAVMAKKRAADEQRGLTFKGAGSSRGSSTTSAITSRVVADVVVLGPPRVTAKNNTYLDVAVLSVNAGEGKGRALVPAAGADSDFKIAPLTDEKGEYLTKSEQTLKGGWKKTEERKPLALAEYGVATLKLGNAPSGPADWASSPALYPGAQLSLKGVAIHHEFKKGTHISGEYVNSSSPDDKMLDMEMPRAAFAKVCDNKGLARRNMMLSTQMGGFTEDWQMIAPTDSTKLYAITTLDNTRNELLKINGAFHKSLKTAAGEGDAEWKSELTSASKALVDGAAYQSGGLGVPFSMATHGATLLIPLIGLDRSQTLSDQMPALESKAGRLLADEEITADQKPFFEGTMAASKDKTIFGGSRNKDGRATGGPWTNLPINGYTMGPDAAEFVSLDQRPFTLKIGLACMPPVFGSMCVNNITSIVASFLPLCNATIAFEPDLKNVRQNDKADETWDARISTVDFHSALVKDGIPLDVEATLSVVEDWPIHKEEKEIASTMIGAPKDFLACGFALLNESPEARSFNWLEQQKIMMGKILAHKKRSADVVIEIRGINPEGFEEHKASFEELEKIEDQVDRVGEIDNKWLIYAVLVVTDNDPDSASPGDDSDDEPQPPPAKKAKADKKEGSKA